MSSRSSYQQLVEYSNFKNQPLYKCYHRYQSQDPIKILSKRLSYKAMVANKFIQLTSWGPPSKSNLQLQEEQIDPQSLEADDILVKMKYACVHPADMNTLLKNYPHYSVRNNILPTKVGLEGVGEVIKVGNAVKDIKVGDVVTPSSQEINTQNYQQYVITKFAIKVPPNVDILNAAQAVLNPQTAVGLLDMLGIINLQRDQVNSEGYLAISGANSTVGQLLLQITKLQGVKTIAIVRNDDAVALVKDLGATEIIVSNNIKQSEQLVSKIKELTQNQGIRYAIDCVGGYIAEGLYDSLTQYGHIALYGNLSRQDITIKAFSYRTLPKVEGFSLKGYYSRAGPQKKQEAINFIFNQLQKKNLSFPVEKIYPLDQFLDAFEAQVNGTGISRKGKFLLQMD